MFPEENAERNRVEQSRLYGAPLGQIVAELVEVYGISRSRLAGLLGLSAPMLSQLAAGHRLKIGNPVAVQRLQSLVAHVPEVRDGRTPAVTVMTEVEEQSGAVITRSQFTRLPGHDPRTSPALAALRAVADPVDLREAAQLLSRFPQLAALLLEAAAAPAVEEVTRG